MNRPFTPVDRPYRDTERATPAQLAAAVAAIQGTRTELVQQGWWKVYDADGALIGDLHRERAWTGEPMLYHGRTPGGRRAPVCVAEPEPVIASLLAAYLADSGKSSSDEGRSAA